MLEKNMMRFLGLLALGFGLAFSGKVPSSINSDDSPSEEVRCGRLYYRTLHLDERNDALYVGGMDRVIKVDARNVSRTDCERDTMHMEATAVAECVGKGKSRDFDCRNHIRVIQPIGEDGDKLYVCGTNAHSPKDQVVYANLTKLGRHEFYPGIGNGVAKCPFDPEDNSTAVWVESGNPGGHAAIYSGTNAEFTKADTVIFRGDIFDADTGRREYSFKRTIKYDSHMLDKPDFVGSYEVGDHVYFFFREMAVEYMNCGRAVYSRIARVCKRDTGGKNILAQNWATYLKVRLNCSIPGEFPFFFNEIQDVYKADYDDSTFHATFTTSNNGISGSAVCSFRLKDIEDAFNGKFKEQATSTSMWLPVPDAAVPEPRPGSCVPDTRSLPDTVLNFIRKHPLMDGDVAHDGTHSPVFYSRDVTFTKIAVDQVVSTTSRRYGGKSAEEFTVYYAGTSDGKIYKISRWADKEDGGKFKSKLLDVIEATPGEPVRAMAISRTTKMLYVTSDSTIRQFRLTKMCGKHRNCVECTADPYCGWSSDGTCQSQAEFRNLIQDPSAKLTGVCESAAGHESRVSAVFGSSLHLGCKLGGRGESRGLEWHHYDVRGKSRRVSPSSKHVFTQDDGLVIIGASEADAGRYECRLGGARVTAYAVTVDMGRCAAPDGTADYQKVYSAWCNEFQKYKSALKTWEKKRSQCPNNNNLTSAEAQRIMSAAASSSNYNSIYTKSNSLF